MQYLISIITGYVIGSIPTAYLLLKITKGIDIRKSGSGNVGAFNSLETSKSKVIGLLVLLIDFAKGFFTAFFLMVLFTNSFILPAIGVCAAVLSHNYNPWLKFKGGRGLATAAGGATSIFPFLLIIWCTLWTISFLYKRNVILANVSATVLSFFLVISSINIAIKYTYPPAVTNIELILFSCILLLLILTKHIIPFKDEIKKLNLFSRGNKNAK